MNITDTVWLIFLVACVGLVITLIVFVLKLMQLLSTTNEVLKETKNTMDVLTKDVDSLSIEVEGLLNKVNLLVDDINGKLAKTDPAFEALGNLGVTVTQVNESANNLTRSFKLKRKSATNHLAKVSQSIGRIVKSSDHAKKKASKTVIKKY